MTAGASQMAAKAAASPQGRTLMTWAVGGWSLFIAENFILSENRTWLIQQLGDEGYHMCYGICSTAACGTIGYAYLKKLKPAAAAAASGTATVTTSITSLTAASKYLTRTASPAAKAAGFLCYSLGLGMLSQIPPKFQIPVTHDSSSSTSSQEEQQQTAAATPATSGGGGWKVRCPFDFTDSRSSNDDGDADVSGLDRISRHPGLWSFGFIGVGQACMVPGAAPAFLALRAWWCMPLALAFVGGAHTDSRYQRSMGGQPLSDKQLQQTSNVPFWAMLQGGQQTSSSGGGVSGALESFRKLCLEESKPLNFGFSVTLASMIVLRRPR
jgi:hypothetical protein